MKVEGGKQKEEGIPIGVAVVQRVEKAMPADFPNEPYLGLDDVEAHTMRLLGSKVSGDMKSAAKRFYPGDVLYSRLRPYLNKVWYADRSGLCSAEFIVLPANDFIDGHFLKYRLNARDFVSFANSLNAGDRPRVDFDQISAFCLPPFALGYQRKLVARIEELFSELDAGEESLRQARRQLGIYRQSLLKQAFEGKLTAQWRKQNPGLLESPDQILTRIQDEREARYEEQLKDWKETFESWENSGQQGKRPAKPRKPKPAALPLDDQIAELSVLPHGWSWMAVNACALETSDGPFGSNLKTSDYVGSGVRVIRLENIGAGEFIEEKESFITEEKYELLKRHTVRPGDIVFASFINDAVRATLVPPSIELAVNKADCFKVHCFGESLSADYLVRVFGSRFFFKELEELVHGVGRPRINTTQLGEALIPLCSLPEQQEIVRLLDEQFTVIEQNERELDAALKRSEALRQSILKKAFTGHLVPKNPTDEPAKELLARIREEREAAATKKPKKKVARKRTTSA